MAVVTFDPALFKAQYPEFAAVDNSRLQLFFMKACLQLNNTDCSIVCDVNERALLLNMLVAHIGKLAGALSTSGSNPPPVGRASQAAEGSVSVTFEYQVQPGSGEAYYIQTPYGAEYWNATSKYRHAFYIPNPTVY